MKTYHGTRTPRGLSVTVHHTENGQTISKYTLDPRLNLRNHSPDGFECGYLGSGPSQLALAILADLYGPEKALEGAAYQDFKARVIAHLPRQESWTLTEREVRRVMMAGSSKETATT